MASMIHDPKAKPDEILSAADAVIEDLHEKPVSRALIDRALVKWRSDLYSTLATFGGFGKANLLASFALFDDDPSRINGLELQLRKVTPELIQKTAKEYLRKSNRTVLIGVPAEGQPGAPKETGE
jgi:predicted Zn-dependent peptidase